MRKIVARLLLLSIALAIGAMPLSARGCIPSNDTKQSCGSCCPNKACCAAGDKKDDSAAQPLAANGPGHELSFNISVSWSEIVPTFYPAERSLNQLRLHSGTSPPHQAVLCTFLI